MKFEHPQFAVDEPTPGSFVLRGLPHKSVFVEGEGHHVYPSECIIRDDVPTEFLQAVIDARGGFAEQMAAESFRAHQEQVKQGDALGFQPSANILDAISDGPKRIGELAESLGVTVDDIKALDGQGFEIASGGWVRLKKEGGAE